ncbi:MAG: hypothetical protein HY782_16370 [Chloroflexi bacterium]|nr:hypothetical protein [Chloroflexota bacterium]
MRTRLGQLYGAIVVNAGSLVGTSLVTSTLGFLYWWLAARQFSPQAVGLAVAAISPMMLLANVGMLGLGTLLMGELPRSRGNAGPLVSTALVAAGGAGIALGVVFAIGAPLVAPGLPLNDSIATVALFAVGVGLATVTLVLDQVLIGLFRGGVQLGRNTVFAIAKLAALAAAGLWLAGADGMTIFATWTFGNLVSLVAVAGLAYGKTTLHRPQFGLLRHIGRRALVHHALNLALQAPSLALPIVVAVVLSAAATAYFYTTWMVASFVFIGPFALTLALYAAASADPTALTRKIRFTLGVGGAIGVAAILVVQFGADQMLALFGVEYASQGAVALRIISLGVLPLVVKDHYVAVRRIGDGLGQAALFVTAGAVAELALAALGAAVGGLGGLAVGWVAAVFIEAAFGARVVYRAAVPQTTAPQLALFSANYANPR